MHSEVSMAGEVSTSFVADTNKAVAARAVANIDRITATLVGFVLDVIKEECGLVSSRRGLRFHGQRCG